MMFSRVEYNKFADEHFITIPDDIIELLNLEVGDILEWTIIEGKVYLAKREKK
jgi:bifunctional DNA-binding transcriptional regulator/antitoxin component of YhaV-PrlF toxin-antitoxin module